MFLMDRDLKWLILIQMQVLLVLLHMTLAADHRLQVRLWLH
jgi:hypothetical protein